MNYLELFKSLEEQQVKYLICGGLAMNLHGVPRMTADIDLLIEYSSENLTKISKVFTQLGYQKSIPIELDELKSDKFRQILIDEKNLIAFSFYNTSTQAMSIDLLVKTPKPFNNYWENKIVRKVGDSSILLISPQDLIEMKRFANRAQDNDDIQSLLKLRKNG